MEKRKHPSPADVAEAFVKQYYVILHKSPENLHRFYQEPSLLGWPGVDGVMSPVTTLDAINEKVMSSIYKNCSVEVKSTDAQESLGGGIVVAVTGCLNGNNNLKKNFSQTFVLAKQEKGFFVLNDILRFFDVCKPTTDAAVRSDDKNDESAPTHDSAPCDAPSSLDFKAAIQNGKIEGAKDLSASANNFDNGCASTPLGEMPIPPPDESKRKEKVPPVVKPALNVSLKITYASVLAKEIPAISPRTSAVTAASPSPTTKPLSPRVDVSPKVSTPSNSAYAEAKGIYMGGLPYDITKQGIIDVVKQFGQVRRYSDAVQIRRHEDGFCCGFVEFESSDSARRAVEAHHVMFGDKEAYITYKRLPYSRGSNGRARGEGRNGNSTGAENDDWTYYNKGRARVPHRSNSSDQRWRQTSRDRV